MEVTRAGRRRQRAADRAGRVQRHRGPAESVPAPRASAAAHAVLGRAAPRDLSHVSGCQPRSPPCGVDLRPGRAPAEPDSQTQPFRRSVLFTQQDWLAWARSLSPQFILNKGTSLGKPVPSCAPQVLEPEDLTLPTAPAFHRKPVTHTRDGAAGNTPLEPVGSLLPNAWVVTNQDCLHLCGVE